MVGASTPRIVRTHILPHLVGPIAVYFAIICAANIVLESAISFLNIGVPLPDASWGNMLATNWGHFFIVDQPGFSSGIQTSTWTTVFPAAAIALTVLCLALIGEGVREAFDPGSRSKAVRAVSYIVRRVLSGLVIVFALTWMTFALFWLLPAEPWRAIVTDPEPDEGARSPTANHKLGVDRPVVVQYGKFVWGIVRHGSFGRDYYTNEPVTTFLKQALPVTWSIVFGGVILLFVLALPLATISALWANTAIDRIILTVTIAGVALHPFIIGIGLRGLFANRLGWLPAYYYCPLRGTTELSTTRPGQHSPTRRTTCGGIGGWSSHLALPWLTFAVIFLPLYVRMLRGAIVEVLESRVHPDGAREGRRDASACCACTSSATRCSSR